MSALKISELFSPNITCILFLLESSSKLDILFPLTQPLVQNSCHGFPFLSFIDV